MTTGPTTPTEAVAGAYRRLEQGQPAAWIAVVPEAEAMARAVELEAEGPHGRPLWGVPFAVKDNIDVVGLPTTAACPAFAYRPDRTAAAVQRLLDAGAVLVGKTNLDQFATGLVGTRSPYGVCHSVQAADRIAGGSSVGSAVAVAEGVVPFALGTDTAGSGRVPAAANGIVGLKPSRDLVPTDGIVPACRSVDCVSVFARTVADAWPVLQVLAGPLAGSSVGPLTDSSIRATSGRPPVRVGVPRESVWRLAPDEEAAYRETLTNLADDRREVDIAPLLDAGALLYEGSLVAERLTTIGPLLDRDPEAVHPVVRQVVSRGLGKTAVDVFTDQHRLIDLRRAMADLWQEVDVLVCPTVPDIPTLAEVAADPVGVNSRLGRWTQGVNLLDLCGVTVASGTRADGLPGSVTVLGPRGADARVAAVAARIAGERAPTSAEPGPRRTRRSGPAGEPADHSEDADRIALAVVGAHLSGLPLNHQLTDRGAHLLGRARTAPCYRLHALATEPPKPGLLRVAEGGGAVDAEIWSLSPAAFGTFVADVPPPLTIGTVQLSDGTTVKGFLCEPAALDGTEDITALGSWRAYLDRPSG